MSQVNENSVPNFMDDVPSQSTFNPTPWQRSQLQLLQEEGIQCLVNMWKKMQIPVEIQEPYCDAVWDNYTCWPPTAGGDIAKRACAEITGDVVLPGHAVRFCNKNGTWGWDGRTIYQGCQADETLEPERDRSLKYAVALILFVCSILSLVCLVAALLIFHYFKNIRCDRIILHNHFMIALALKCLTYIILAEARVFGITIQLLMNNLVCKMLVGTQMFASIASVNWMFVQGHYLNAKLTTNIFGRNFPLKFYIIFGWGFSLVTVGIWCAVMESFHVFHCWQGYARIYYVWIVAGPMLAVLLVNLIFLVNIIRVLLKKYQGSAVSGVDTQVRRAIKATFILFPLLGLNMLFWFNPGGEYKAYYYIANAFLHSSQGVFVAVLYCFACNEVRDAIRRFFLRLSVARELVATDRNTEQLALSQL